MLDVNKIRKDFPVLEEKIGASDLIYLDNAATTQMPLCVQACVREHYLHNNANVHRGIHELSERSTEHFEAAREAVRDFLHADSAEEIIFTSGTTDSINLVASGMEELIDEKDTIVVTELEHHSDFLPWQRLCRQTGASFVVIPCPDGQPDMNAFRQAMECRPKLMAVTQVSNLTGTVMPLQEMISSAHEAGAWFLVDGAQGVRHRVPDVKALDCDFYCFSGHKVMGPTGIGVLYGKKACLMQLEPSRVGGGMVDIVDITGSTYGPLPTRLEAGTPNYVGAIGLAEALRYLQNIGLEEIADYETKLITYAEERLRDISEIRILGDPKERAGAISFVIAGVHPYDAASILDKLGVALRSGTHCAQPALAMFGESAALRLSVAFYNTKDEIDTACEALVRTIRMVQKWTK